MALTVTCMPSTVYELRCRGIFFNGFLRIMSCWLPIYQPIYPSSDISLSL
jgi:hypothetical protein